MDILLDRITAVPPIVLRVAECVIDGKINTEYPGGRYRSICRLNDAAAVPGTPISRRAVKSTLPFTRDAIVDCSLISFLPPIL